ncbi:MAG: glycosyltransferase [Pseudomonadota bacterium]|nr:glycosyltransferase [Pseudomonadota bacterium]
MHRPIPDAPSEDEVQQHLAGLTHEIEQLGKLVAGDLHWYERSETISTMTRAQACLNGLVASTRASTGTSPRLTSSHFQYEQDRLVMTRRQLGDIARSLQTARAQVHHDTRTAKAILDSSFWKLTGPLRCIVHLLRSPEELRYRWKLFLGKGGRPTKPSVTTQPELAPEQALVDAEHELLKLTLPPARDRKLDIYMWGVIDWHFRFQRPQHLARVLAKRGHRVFYISNEFIDRPHPGFTVEPLDDHGRLYQVHLYLENRPPIYHDAPLPAQITQLDAGLVQLARWNEVDESISILHHSYWRKLAGGVARTRIVYDCLDHQAGFTNNSPSVLAEEHSLLKSADLVVATSQWLKDELDTESGHVSVIRNAGDYEFFSKQPAHAFADPAGRKVIGYYGAIDTWFDIALVRAIAERFPQHLVLLIGRDSGGAANALSDRANVRWNNEVKYTDLPFWLYGFDVCLLPFQVLPLTLATNPVKIYEYLSAGKPVVAVDLPEMSQFGDLIRTASTHAGFLDAIAQTLDGDEDASLPLRRREFAAQQTWEHRVDELEEVIDAMLDEPLASVRVSVIVVTYGNLNFTRNCLDSLQRFSAWPDLEVIVVDNASQDGTPEFLEAWRDGGESRHIILNADNRGFAAANNQGLAIATGDYLILLNNDTFVTQGWVRGLVSHLRSDDGIGLVGPVTNNIGNEAKIDINYNDMEEMAVTASEYTLRHGGRSFDISTPAFFCVAMTRATYEKVGPLDEAFGVGFFEDDDYCRRIEQQRLRCVCAEDVFIHHHLSASFNELRQEERQALFERNKRIYESKWGPWRPHVYR